MIIPCLGFSKYWKTGEMVSFPFSIWENIKISKHAFQFAKKYKKVYMAAVNDKPKETAYTIDYQRLLSKFTSTQTTRAFSTFEAAQNWLFSIPAEAETES